MNKKVLFENSKKGGLYEYKSFFENSRRAFHKNIKVFFENDFQRKNVIRWQASGIYIFPLKIWKDSQKRLLYSFKQFSFQKVWEKFQKKLFYSSTLCWFLGEKIV